MARKRPPATPQTPVPPAGVRKRSQPGMFVEAEWRGIKVLRKWPRRRTAEENAKRLASCQLFYDRVKTMKTELAATQIAARQMSDGSALLPRDVQMMLMSNSYYGTFEIDGQLYFPREAMTEVSTALDVLNRTPGAILYRGPDGWVGLLPGEAGDVLTLSGDPARPTWAQGGGGGGGGVNPILIGTTVSTTLAASKGITHKPDFSYSARSITAIASPLTGTQFQFSILRLNGPVVQSVVYRSPVFPAQVQLPYAVTHHFPAPLTIEAGLEYGLVLTDVTAAATRAVRIIALSHPIIGSPQYTSQPKWLRATNLEPKPGDIFELGDPGLQLFAAALYG